jgi:hypothetical protein
MGGTARTAIPGPQLVPKDRLDSWKEIATYLSRGERTVQRWEREEGLPVHRLTHQKQGSVFAYKEELDAWWESRRALLGSNGQAAEAKPRVRRWAIPAMVAGAALLVALGAWLWPGGASVVGSGGQGERPCPVRLAWCR